MSWEEDHIWDAVSEALQPVAHLEVEWDLAKLTKRLKDYFRKGAKGLEYHDKTWLALINDYADSVFASIFQALGDRKWLSQVDFLFVLDAAIKDTFPKHLLERVPTAEFERAVLSAHDRAFEEQRYLPRLWDSVESLGLTGKARKKSYDAVEEGRKVAVKYLGQSPNEVKAFLSRWTDITVANLSKTTQGDPESAMPEIAAVRLFHSLIEADALPIALTSQHGPPPERWPFVDFAVRTAYAAHCGEAGGTEFRDKGKGKARGKGYGAKGGSSFIRPEQPVKEEAEAVIPGWHAKEEPSWHAKEEPSWQAKREPQDDFYFEDDFYFDTKPKEKELNATQESGVFESGFKRARADDGHDSWESKRHADDWR
ncbi:unnamed protein product [Polarella glacialis]|uniref:Uncharacterized protein n=2 Tax=Polarella glacialis TaxID=89957 RepID=A0A813EYY4_POLGL|nr:unnamed protein product [Polarella glacialis]